MTIADLTRTVTADLTRTVTAVLRKRQQKSGLAVCEEQGTTEQTGEAIDGTAEQSAEMPEIDVQKSEESGEKVQEGAE